MQLFSLASRAPARRWGCAPAGGVFTAAGAFETRRGLKARAPGESPYRALSDKGDPEFGAIPRVIEALGLRLRTEVMAA